MSPAQVTTVEKVEGVCKALGDQIRLRVLALLGNNEVCVCHIHDSLRVPQPTVSRHLAYLRRAGLVQARRDGVWMHYRLSDALDPAVREIVAAAVKAVDVVPTTSKDKRQFTKAFGPLYVLEAAGGGTCCAPRG